MSSQTPFCPKHVQDIKCLSTSYIMIHLRMIDNNNTHGAWLSPSHVIISIALQPRLTLTSDSLISSSSSASPWSKEAIIALVTMFLMLSLSGFGLIMRLCSGRGWRSGSTAVSKGTIPGLIRFYMRLRD